MLAIVERRDLETLEKSKDHSPAEIAAMRRAAAAILARWGVSAGDSAVILDGIPPETSGRWRGGDHGPVNRDFITRMSYIVGIHAALRVIFADPAQGYAWMRRPNQKLAGRTPLALLLDGGMDDLRRLHRYLDSVRAGW